MSESMGDYGQEMRGAYHEWSQHIDTLPVDRAEEELDSLHEWYYGERQEYVEDKYVRNGGEQFVEEAVEEATTLVRCCFKSWVRG